MYYVRRAILLWMIFLVPFISRSPDPSLVFLRHCCSFSDLKIKKRKLHLTLVTYSTHCTVTILNECEEFDTLVNEH